MLAVGLALNFSIRRMARRLRLESPRSRLLNSVEAQLIFVLCYEISSLAHGVLVYHEMRLPLQAVAQITEKLAGKRLPRFVPRQYSPLIK